MRASRRWLLRVGCAALAARALPGAAAPPRYPAVRPDTPVVFPRDHGAHESFRTEWWYLTGWLRDGAERIGFQLTFFRSRTAHDDANPSRFAPRQLLVAHAALSRPGQNRLRHGQRAARTGFGLAQASSVDTELELHGWRLRRSPDDRYRSLVTTPEFTLDLLFTPPGPPVLQGERGYSRKGPQAAQASHYYSRPQLSVSGSIRVAPGTANSSRSVRAAAGTVRAVSGTAWLDHEWSSEVLAADAIGWDWIGLNLDDGSALMAFRIRRADGSVLWSHARWISAGEVQGGPEAARGEDGARVVFEPLRQWRSPRSGATYPVAMQVQSAGRTLALQPLLDDQELDARTSAGTIYWEGAVSVVENGVEIGRGYLELTGYAGRPPV